VAGAFAADVHHPITTVDTFTAVVNHQRGGSDLLLTTQQAKYMFCVNASGPTVGGEQLTVTGRRIAGKLRWYITDLTEAEVPARGVVCPEQSYQEACDLSQVDYGTGSVGIWVFFTPVETHSGPLEALISFEASQLAPLVFQPALTSVVFLDPGRTAAQIEYGASMSNTTVSPVTLAPVAPQVAGERISIPSDRGLVLCAGSLQTQGCPPSIAPSIPPHPWCET
jgi:hypothetical protein